MAGQIVARSRSRFGGHCKDCPNWIKAGEVIVKISDEGPTTKGGNGPGRWVCEKCAEEYEEE